MEILAAMIKNLVILTFLTVLVDLMLPGGSFRRYVKMVYGLAVILVLIVPLAQFFDGIPDFDISLRQAQLDLDQEILSVQAGKDLEVSRQQLILDTYRSRIGEEVTRFLERQGHWQVEKVQVDVVADFNSDSFGQVTAITAQIVSKETSGDNHTIDPIVIAPVEVSPAEQAPPATTVMAPELAGSLADYFMLQTDQVEVRVISPR